MEAASPWQRGAQHWGLLFLSKLIKSSNATESSVYHKNSSPQHYTVSRPVLLENAELQSVSKQSSNYSIKIIPVPESAQECGHTALRSVCAEVAVALKGYQKNCSS